MSSRWGTTSWSPSSWAAWAIIARSRSSARTSRWGTTKWARSIRGSATWLPNIPFGTTSASIAICSPPCAASVTGKLWWKGSSPAWNPVESRTNPSPPSQSSSSTGSPAQASGTSPLAANWTGVATTGQKSPRVRLVLVPPAVNDQSAIGCSRALRQARSSSRRRAIRS